MKELLLYFYVAVTVFALLGGLGYLDYLAFREKFPDAAWLAWLFSQK